MHCPVDHSALTSHPKAENDVLGCKQCHGLWLSKRGVYAAWKHANGRVAARPRFYWHQTNSGASNGRKCPSCTDVLMTQSRLQKIEYDICPKCEGIWFDNGELDEILKWYRLNYKSKTSAANMAAAAPMGSDPVLNSPFFGLPEILEICWHAPGVAVDLAVAVFHFIVHLF